MLKLVAVYSNELFGSYTKALAISKITSVKRFVNYSVVVNGSIILQFPGYDAAGIDEVINKIKKTMDDDSSELQYINTNRRAVIAVYKKEQQHDDRYQYVQYSAPIDHIKLSIRDSKNYREVYFNTGTDTDKNMEAASEYFKYLCEKMEASKPL